MYDLVEKFSCVWVKFTLVHLKVCYQTFICVYNRRNCTCPSILLLNDLRINRPLTGVIKKKPPSISVLLNTVYGFCNWQYAFGINNNIKAYWILISAFIAVIKKLSFNFVLWNVVLDFSKCIYPIGIGRWRFILYLEYIFGIIHSRLLWGNAFFPSVMHGIIWYSPTINSFKSVKCLYAFIFNRCISLLYQKHISLIISCRMVWSAHFHMFMQTKIYLPV